METKFKAWDKKRKTMLGPFTFWDLHKDGQDLEHGNGSIFINSKHGLFKQEDFIFVEPTVLKDSKGKDIYFDDIVRFSFLDKNDPESFWGGTALITKTMNGGAGLLFDYEGNEAPKNVHAVEEGGQLEDLWEDEDLWEIAVIGNFYENRELINEKN